MRKDCTKFLEGLSRLAEGGEDALAAFHSASCADCARRLEQFREIYSAASRSYFDAPPTDIERAIALMPKRNRHIATLVRSSLVLAGARAVREDFQLLVDIGTTQMRIMYSQTAQGWEVRGRTPGEDWEVAHNDVPLSLMEGGFVFTAGGLDETGFTVKGPLGDVEVPAAEELLGLR